MAVIVALDDSEPAWAAYDYALEAHADDGIVLLHVINPVETVYGEYGHVGGELLLDKQRERAKRIFERAEHRAEAMGVEQAVETKSVVGAPAREILRCVDERRESVEGVVLGSHGRKGVSRVLLGSVAESVTRKSPVPVTIVR